jgi:hypothetical protein
VSPCGIECSGRLRMRLRGVFVRVDAYLRLCRLGAQRRRLDPLVDALMVDLRECFGLGALLHADDRMLAAQRERCLRDLERFLAALRSDTPPAQLEIVHALDDVVVHCVGLDSGRRLGARARPGPTAQREQ